MPQDLPNSNPAKRSGALPVVAIIVIVGGALFILTRLAERSYRNSQGEKHPIVGQKLSTLNLEPLTGTDKPIRTEDLLGKVTLINYWGTWCGPCRKEFPHIAMLHRNLGENPKFQLFSISCPASPDVSLDTLRSETTAHLAEYQATFPTYVEGHDMESALVMLLQSPGLGIPMTFVVDQEGRIRGYWEGYNSGDEIDVDRLIRALLQETA